MFPSLGHCITDLVNLVLKLCSVCLHINTQLLIFYCHSSAFKMTWKKRIKQFVVKNKKKEKDSYKVDEVAISSRPKEKHGAAGKDIHRQISLCIYVWLLHKGIGVFWVSIYDLQRFLCIIQ